MNDNPIGVTEHGDVVFPLRTDASVAQELRDDLTPLLVQVCAIMQKAKDNGLGLSWNVQPDSYGRIRVIEISIVKPL